MMMQFKPFQALHEPLKPQQRHQSRYRRDLAPARPALFRTIGIEHPRAHDARAGLTNGGGHQLIHRAAFKRGIGIEDHQPRLTG